MDHGSRRAIIAAFLANLGIALSKFVGVRDHRRGVDARRGDPLGCRHRQPGPAHAGRRAGRAVPPTRCTTSATARCATSGRSSSRSCCSASADCSRSSKASRSCSTRTSSRTRGWRSACCSSPSCSSRSRCGPRCGRAAPSAGEVDPPVRPPHEDPGAGGRRARGHRRARSASASRSSGVILADVLERAALGRGRQPRDRCAPRRDRDRARGRDGEPARRRGGRARRGRTDPRCARGSPERQPAHRAPHAARRSRRHHRQRQGRVRPDA